jgi:RNA polymerase sigma factor for flagellar operon FliA
MKNPAEAWRKLRESNNPKLRSALTRHYQSLVRNLALGVLRKLRSGSELEDLISHGNFGLARAIDGFDPSRGFKFETYATPIVRGAMNNGLRQMDWLPERGRSKTSDVKAATRKLQQATGRDPSTSELAEELAITADEVHEMIASLGCVYLLSLEQPLGVEDDSEITMMDLVDGFPDEPAQEVELSEYRQKLRRAIEQLNDERYKFLLTQHYFQGVTLEDIARELGVSRQRVRQMHTFAIRRLRNPKGNDGPDFLPPAASGTQPPGGGPPGAEPPEARQPARLVRPPKTGGPGNALRQPED